MPYLSRRTRTPGMLWGLLATLLLALAGQAAAAESDKPFAEHKIVLQISDDDPAKQTLVLNVANNLVNHYGADKVDIEIVAFGPGLRLLFAENVNKDRIGALVEASGVRFSACENTVAAMTRALGEAPALNPQAIRVKAGIVRILDLTGQGYTLVKP
ncbi:MAG: hypothetical protein LOY58_12900 [Gammaproteobacteria bacterium]|nr:hypothetical protein [Gammaproteobacteria bacterium]